MFLLYAAASAVLAVLVWLYVSRLLRTGRLPELGWLGLVILIPGLELVTERTLASIGISHTWRYRLAFLGSAVLFILAWSTCRGASPSTALV